MAQPNLLIPLLLATATMLATPYVMNKPGVHERVQAKEAASSGDPVDLTEVPGRQAFPGADGFGRFAQGGRGGVVIPVTTLADAGPGSLRSCIDADIPRICVFRVGGVIRFTGERPIIRNPFITIAGQTAPGSGILITHAGGAGGFTPIVVKRSHDVIIRHIRVRTDLNGLYRGANGSFTFEESHDVIFDHVSGSWALDQIVSGEGFNNNITISNSIFTQGIPRHDKCALLASNPRFPQMISFLRNLCAHNGDRNPDVNVVPGSCTEIVNNVFYNAESQFAEVHETEGGSPVNIVGNIFRKGPNTRADIAAVDRVLVASSGASRIFVQGNRLDGVRSISTMPVGFVQADRPVCPLNTRALPADQAYRDVLAFAGAHPRDSLDRQTIEEVRKRTGQISKDRSFLSGPRLLPLMNSGTPYADSDGDGMSDRWEAANGTDPSRKDMWEDVDRDGWANLDEFLDFAHRQVTLGRVLH